jgi:hypothetical protein
MFDAVRKAELFASAFLVCVGAFQRCDWANLAHLWATCILTKYLEVERQVQNQGPGPCGSNSGVTHGSDVLTVQ